MRISTIVAALAAVCVGCPSFAATLQSVNGQVSINRGTGFRPASAGAEVRAGDVIMASPGATAQVVYADGCKAPVSPGAVVTIQAESPCAGAYAQVVEPNPYIVAGALVASGAGVAAIVVTSQNNNNNQLFPPLGSASP